ncbi:hypothetical protein DN590_01070 [Citrobacter freundii]|nr:hypothetical protein DN590_01070 [Citrobacter freundii]
MAGRTPAINCQALIKVKKPILTDGLFCVCAACRLIRPAGAGLNVFCRPDKRSASGNAAVHCRIRRNSLNRPTKAHCLDLLHGSLPRTYLNPFSAN